MVNTEILAQANAFGMRIHEIKVTHYPRRAGKASGANLRVIAKAFRELFRLWGQLRNVTHEQPGLFQTELPASAATKVRRGDAYNSGTGGTSVISGSLRVEAAAQSRVTNRCFAD